jgi:putative oxidoreductase
VHNIDGYWAGIFLVRIALGIVMLAHGYNHIWGGGKIKGTAGWFESLGMKPGILHAWLASVTELAVGVMLIFGFLLPLAAAGVMGVMLVALITNHLKNGFFIFRPGEGYEYVLTLLIVSFGLAGIGAGKWSIDHFIHGTAHSWLWGLKGLGVAAVAGLGGGALLLAVFWRPAPKSES